MVYRRFEITGDEFKEKLEKLVEQEKIDKMYPLVEEKNFTPRTAVYKSGFYTIELCQIEGDKREVVISRYNHSEKTIEEKIQEIEEWTEIKLGEPTKN